MNTCCTVPIKEIAADQHKEGGECCLIEQTPAPALATCPVSKTSSRKINRRTLEHLLKPDSVKKIQNVQYYYCNEPSCDVVYFSHQGPSYFIKADLTVKIFHKDNGDNVNVCYCFDWTRERIEEQIRSTGQSTASQEIAQLVKDQKCICDITNPKGRCCLGDINRVIKEVKQQQKL